MLAIGCFKCWGVGCAVISNGLRCPPGHFSNGNWLFHRVDVVSNLASLGLRQLSYRLNLV
jgi:hypothetical protein